MPEDAAKPVAADDGALCIEWRGRAGQDPIAQALGRWLTTEVVCLAVPPRATQRGLSAPTGAPEPVPFRDKCRRFHGLKLVALSLPS